MKITRLSNEQLHRIAHDVAELLGDSANVHIEQINRNNLSYVGFIIQNGDKLISPILPLTDYEEGLISGDLQEHAVAEEIVKAYKRLDPCTLPELPKFDKKFILTNVVYQIVSKTNNESFLSQALHRDFLDLAVIYKVIVTRLDDGNYVTLVLNLDHCLSCDINLAELERAARHNTKSNGFEMLPMNDICIQANMPRTDVSENMLILRTTLPFVNGASVLLYPDFLRQVTGILGSKCYLLPSSIHEIIAVPSTSSWGSVEELREMVCNVNVFEVEPGLVLSNSVYLYDSEMNKVTIA